MKKIQKLYNLFFCFFFDNYLFLKEKLYYQVYKKNLNILLLKKNPLISVIIPTFNRAEMLKTRSVKSVLKQSYKNIEIIVISDGSTDNTREVVNSFNDKRIKFYEISRSKKRYPQTAFNHWLCGPVVAINFGLKKAKGDWIARIDDDDIWSKKHLEISLNTLIRNKCEFVSGKRLELINNKFKISDHSKQWIYNVNWQTPIGGNNTWVYAGYLSFFEANINCWKKRKNRVNDTDLIARMIRAGIKICYSNKATHIGLPRDKNGLVGSKYYLNNEEKILKKYNI